MTRLELVRRIKTESPGVGAPFAEHARQEQFAQRAFKVHGYVTKHIAAREGQAPFARRQQAGADVAEKLVESVVRHLKGSSGAPRHTLVTATEFDVLRRVRCRPAAQRNRDRASPYREEREYNAHPGKLQVCRMVEMIRDALESH